MDELNTIRTLITVGGILASIGGAWYLMRYQINELRAEDFKQDKTITAMGVKLDTAQSALSLLSQKTDVIGSMMAPDAVAEHHKNQTGMQKDIEYLRRDVDLLRK
jgi:hypothetical protein